MVFKELIIYIRSIFDAKGMRTLQWQLHRSSNAAAGFRGDLLSLMFISMGLSRIFSGMVKPVMELTAIQEGWKAVLIDLLAPILFPLSDVLWWIFDAIDSLNPETKKFIGILIVLITAFLALLVPFIMVALLATTLGLGFGFLITVVGLFVAALVWLAGVIATVWNAIKKGAEHIEALFIGLGIGLAAVAVAIASPFILAIGAIIAAVAMAAKIIVDKWDWIKGKVSALIDKIKELGGWIRDILGKAYAGTIGRILGAFQFGGTVPRTGPYLLHQGETVLPAGAMTPNITINANIASGMDVRNIARDLSRYIVADYQRLTTKRGV